MIFIVKVSTFPSWMDNFIDMTIIMVFVGTIFFFLNPHGGRTALYRSYPHADNKRREIGQINLILDSALDAIIQLDGSGLVTGWNKQAEQTFGWTEEEVLHRRLSDLIIPERWRVTHERSLRHAVRQSRLNWPGRRFEVSALHRFGHEFPVELTICSHGSSTAPAFIAFIRDLSEHNLLEDQHILATTVIEHSGEGIVITDTNNKIISVNPAFTEITGYAPEEVIGRDPSLLSSGYHKADFYEAIWSALRNCGRWQGEIWNRRKSGEIYPEWLSIACCRNENDNIINYIAIFSDITVRKVEEERMERLAYFDHLTGLPNRALLKDRLDQALAGARRYHQRVAVLFLDLDRFKSVNDTHGHTVGDILLTDVADRLKDGLREEDTVSRLGGDEFVVVLSDVPDLSHVEVVARKITDSLSRPFIIDGTVIQTGTSIGIAMFPRDSLTVGSLIKAADTAMYQAKEAGRGTYRFFGQ
ncbi:MAG: diguanylate cyclase [Rhodospirillaceae bacterium]